MVTASSRAFCRRFPWPLRVPVRARPSLKAHCRSIAWPIPATLSANNHPVCAIRIARGRRLRHRRRRRRRHRLYDVPASVQSARNSVVYRIL